MLRTAVVVAGLLAGGMLGACWLSIDVGLIATDGGASDATTDASDAAPKDAGAEASEGGCPPGMAQVPVPGDASPAYCVDKTEVTNAAYGAFLEAGVGAPDASFTACAWKTSYANPTGATDRPVAGVDWCDAHEFCAWAGKRLCGAIGGGAMDFSDGTNDAPGSQWLNACSRGGTQPYPYGTTYDASACVGLEYTSSPLFGPLQVGEAAGCAGGYPGLVDMVGNLEEWVDSCTAPDPGCDGGDSCGFCLQLGGGFLNGQDGGSGLSCVYANQVYRNAGGIDTGFRCCSP